MQIGSNHTSPRPLRQSRQDQTNWTLPNDQHGLLRFQAKGLNTFDAGIHRLDKTCLLETDAVRDANRSLLDNPVHHPDVFGKSSARRLEPSGAANFLVRSALREGFVAAVITLSAGDVMKHHNAFANAERLNAFPHFRNDTGSFVTKNTRSGMRAGGDLLQVGPTDAASVDAHQNLSGPDFGHRHFFQAHIVHAAIHRGPHDRRVLAPFFVNGRSNGLFSSQCPSNCHSRLYCSPIASRRLEYETEHRYEYVRQRTLGQVLLDLNRPAKAHQSNSDEGASHDQGNSRARRKVHGLPWNCSAPTQWQSPIATGAVPHDTQI